MPFDPELNSATVVFCIFLAIEDNVSPALNGLVGVKYYPLG